MRGAILSGAFDIRPLVRLSRRHYGFDLAYSYDPSVHKESEIYIDPWDGTRMVNDNMSWALAKVRTLATVCRFDRGH